MYLLFTEGLKIYSGNNVARSVAAWPEGCETLIFALWD